ncbi:MAG: FliH/SctL family protein [Eubacteriales bacterium]|nr:FliH/SctL family protein [Eubacteriales bacterium]
MTKIHKSHSVTYGDVRPVIRPAVDLEAAGSRFHQAGAHALMLSEEQHQAERRSAAERLVEQASLRAEAILKDARQQAESIEQDAFARGFASGIQKARADYEHKALNLQEAFRTALNDIKTRTQEQLDQMEPQLVELSVSIAEKILDLELQRNDQAFVALARQALAKLKACDAIDCRVHESDLAHLTAEFGFNVQSSGQVLSFRADPALEPGSLFLESESGMVNASTSVQLDKIRQLMTAVSR